VVYCSKVCQLSDWKANHKKRCIAKAERAPQPRAPSADCKEAAAEGGITESANPLAFKALSTLGERQMVHKEQSLKNSCSYSMYKQAAAHN
jgi:hypothetical protein